jgi:GNAT superfamily N-acetyltransferase
MIPLIRLADQHDLQALTSLVERYWQFERIPGFDTARITTLLSDFLTRPECGQSWVAQEEDQLVGYLLAVYLFSLEHGGLMAEIDEFFVVPEKRSLKIGAALLDTATVAMSQGGITHIQLQIGTHNSEGHRFYEQNGFEVLSGYRLLYKSLPR